MIDIEKLRKLLYSSHLEDVKVAIEYVSKAKKEVIVDLGFRKGKEQDCDFTYDLKHNLSGGYPDVYLVKGKYYMEISDSFIYIDHPKRALNRIKKGDAVLAKGL